MKNAVTWIVVLAAAGLFVFAYAKLDPQGLGDQPSATERAMCREAKDAGRYMAALGRTPAEVTRVADRLIADRKYPTLGDEGVAATAMLVAAGPNLSPEQIVREIEQSGVCKR